MKAKKRKQQKYRGAQKTPLAVYMAKNGISQAEMAKRLSAVWGGRIYQPTVCAWATGKRIPNTGSRLLIRTVIGGGLSSRLWDRWVKRVEKYQQHRRKDIELHGKKNARFPKKGTPRI